MPRPHLAARGKSRVALRAAFFRQLFVAKSRKTTSIPAILRLDLTKNCSLSPATDFHHGLLAITLAVLISLSGCGAAGPTAPIPRTIPKEVFPVLCEAFFALEGYDPSTVTTFVTKTRPIFRTFALRVLHEYGDLTPSEADQDELTDQHLRATFRESPIITPARTGECQWNGVDPGHLASVPRDELLLEMSNIIEDPFVDASEPHFGIFVRLSLGGQLGASWYWVLLEKRAGAWKVLEVSRLPISDG
ncbi:MAG: hypothetical protein MI919_38910 [Holophagales bacterium]|nr:hypothetical protein [Holophagales bacterium]